MTRTRQFSPQDRLLVVHQGFNHLNQSVSQQPWISSQETQETKPEKFKSLSKKKYSKDGPLRPVYFTTICPEAQSLSRWFTFWRKLYKHERLGYKDLTAFHLINFGSYVPLHSPKDSAIPMQCHLCLIQVEERKLIQHIYSNFQITGGESRKATSRWNSMPCWLRFTPLLKKKKITV